MAKKKTDLDLELDALGFGCAKPGVGKALYERLARERKYPGWSKITSIEKAEWDAAATSTFDHLVEASPPWRNGDVRRNGTPWFSGTEYGYAHNLCLRDELVAKYHSPRMAQATITSETTSYVAEIVTELCEDACPGCGMAAQTYADCEASLTVNAEIAKLDARVDELEQRLVQALGGNYEIDEPSPVFSPLPMRPFRSGLPIQPKAKAAKKRSRRSPPHR